MKIECSFRTNNWKNRGALGSAKRLNDKNGDLNIVVSELYAHDVIKYHAPKM